MPTTLPPDLQDLRDQLDAAERDAEAAVAGLSEEMGTRRPRPESWSVAECLDHLATANRVYLRAMAPAAIRARARGQSRTRPARPGVIGRAFIAALEPPPKWWSRLKAPGKIRPRVSPPLADAFAAFVASQAEARAFLDAHADLDVARVRFSNPLIAGIRFSLATGLHVITAHERRHLLQAKRVRREIEGRVPSGTTHVGAS
jgi:DinB superfamily